MKIDAGWFNSQFFKAYHGQFGSLGSCFSEQGLILRSVVPGLLDFQVWLLLPSYQLSSAVTPPACYSCTGKMQILLNEIKSGEGRGGIT